MKKLFYGGNIMTMERKNDYVEAVYIVDGKIEQVGSLDLFKQQMDDVRVEKINLQGKTMLPGFIDTHSHISLVGPFLKFVDLSECKNHQDIIDKLSAYKQSKQLADDEMIIGFGYDHNYLTEKSHPTKDVLNQVSTDHPVFVSHVSVHVGCANDAGLKLLDIDENTEELTRGVIGRDEHTSEPNGYLEEEAWFLAHRILFNHSSQELEELVTKAQEVYVKNGITTVQDGKTSIDILKLFQTINDKNKFNVDVVAYLEVAEEDGDIKEALDNYRNYDNNLKVGGYKLFLDGSPQGKTAWLSEPYENEESYAGYPWYTDDQVEQFISKSIEDNAQLLVHCNGDAASEQLLNCYEEALSISENPNKHELRPVMIHCQTVRDDQLERMKRLSMIPSIFVTHTYYWGDVHLKNLGEKRGHKISPARTAFEKELIVNFHQDSPILKPDILELIWSAVNRVTRGGKVIGKDEQIEVYDALKAVTINGAYAYFEEDMKGSITEGKLADLVILDENPLDVDKMAIKDIQVLETIKEGTTIYKAKY